MMVVVSYDVAEDENGKRRLRQVAKTCKNYGQRVQYSVFECLVDPAQWAALKSRLVHEIRSQLEAPGGADRCKTGL
jgi:CRISPR-associated protein Cas2